MKDFRLPGRAWAVLRHLAPVVLTEDVVRLGLVDGAVREVERLLAVAPAPARWGFIVGLTTFDAGARALPGARRGGFPALSPAQAEAYFDTWWHSAVPPMAPFAKAAKALLAFGYYELPGTQAHIGYDPAAWIAKVSAERARRFASEIATHEAAVCRRDPIPKTGPAPP